MTENDEPQSTGAAPASIPVAPSDEPAASTDHDADATKVGDIKTVDELIAFAYRQEGKRFKVPGHVFDAVARQPRTSPPGENEEECSEARTESEDPSVSLIRAHAVDDPLLAVPPRLLIEIEDASVEAVLRKRLLLLVSAVLKRHATFRDEALQDCLLTAPSDLAAVFGALRSAASRVRPEDLGLPVKQLKPTEREKLVSNAVTSLALLLGLRDRWSAEEFTDCLHTHLWHPASTSGESRRPRALLADSRTPETLDVVANVFLARARRAESRATDQERFAEHASRRAMEADALVEVRDTELGVRAQKIASLEQQIVQLSEELAGERKSRLVDRSHHVDDYDSLRTRVIRMLDKQTDLLSDGLHALKNGSTDVTEEYLDRALTAFSRELEHLKNEEGGS